MASGFDAYQDLEFKNNAQAQLVRFETALNYEGHDKLVLWREYQKNAEANKNKTIKLSSGFPELDSYTEGFETGELIAISGNTGQGKTLFGKSLIRSFTCNEVPTLAFSYEVPTYQFLQSYDSLAERDNLPLFVPQSMITGNLDWICDRVLEAKAKFNNRVVFIDHLHYIVDMGDTRNFSLNVGNVLRTIKQKIAIDMNQIVFIICHQQHISSDKEPGIESIRDSSFIGQESDMVFIVHRLPDKTSYMTVEKGSIQKKNNIPPNEYTYDLGNSMVKIDKCRRTGVYRKKLHFQKKGFWLEPL